ncbi:SapC family protein [Emcibacter nanhaiensis]|uniref:SapC family protein n=1 Tax=Emcibacter nanhaiensis TaxID=1505037 RepID=A0A501PD24_9PROT|nr:SapC family protein [Emcibacter nanhaiensis]TPD57804.1 SapC family protein [Emcibacter nanhaiensis]
MTAKFSTVNHEAHRNLKIKENAGFAHIRDQHVAPLALHEFVKMASSLPIAFVKPQESDEFHAVAMMGLKPGENLVVKDGSWNAVYAPASVAIHPFSLARTPNKDKNEFVLTVDENSPHVSESEGHALFDEEGKGTEFLENCKKMVMEHFDHIQVSRQLIKLLADKELIAENTLAINSKNDGENYNIRGIFFIDEKKLDALPAEEFEELRKLGLLPAIYAQLASLHQVHRLHNMSES